jgi:hypothetical protein
MHFEESRKRSNSLEIQKVLGRHLPNSGRAHTSMICLIDTGLGFKCMPLARKGVISFNSSDEIQALQRISESRITEAAGELNASVERRTNNNTNLLTFRRPFTKRNDFDSRIAQIFSVSLEAKARLLALDQSKIEATLRARQSTECIFLDH